MGGGGGGNTMKKKGGTTVIRWMQLKGNPGCYDGYMARGFGIKAGRHRKYLIPHFGIESSKKVQGTFFV